MASTDARPVPIKNTAYRVYFPILDADGDFVTGAAGLDSEASLDGAAFADCTNEATEIGSSGVYYLDLTAAEMNADAIVVQVKTSTVGAKTTPLVFYPQESGDILVTTQAMNANVLTASALATDAVDEIAAAINASGGSSGGSAASLLDGLTAYYKLDDASGVRWDWLTKGAGLAATFTAANTESLSRADNASLSTGDVDFTFAGWVYIPTDTTSELCVCGKSLTTGNQREYILRRSTANRFQWLLSSAGTANDVALTASTYGAVPTGTWMFVVAWHDSVANQVGIRIFDPTHTSGAADTSSYVSGCFDSTATFYLGAYQTGSFANFDGRMACCGFWKTAAGGGGVLTAAQQAALYNGGVPRLYRTLQPDELVGLISYWELNEVSGNRADSHSGGLTLTDNNTVTSSGGIGNSLTDVNTVASASGKVGNAGLFTIANSETLVGADSAELRATDTDFSFGCWVNLTSLSTSQTIFAKDDGTTREYRLDYITGTNRFRWIVYDGASAIGTVTHSSAGALVAGTWYYVYVYHDATNNLVGISVNAGTTDTAATTGAASSGTSQTFRIGSNASGTPQYLGGMVDELSRYRRILSDSEVDSEYASGAGTTYPFV